MQPSSFSHNSHLPEPPSPLWQPFLKKNWHGRYPTPNPLPVTKPPEEPKPSLCYNATSAALNTINRNQLPLKAHLKLLILPPAPQDHELSPPDNFSFREKERKDRNVFFLQENRAASVYGDENTNLEREKDCTNKPINYSIENTNLEREKDCTKKPINYSIENTNLEREKDCTEDDINTSDQTLDDTLERENNCNEDGINALHFTLEHKPVSNFNRIFNQDNIYLGFA